jgi:nucleoid-associated protein YgaU
MSRMRYLAAGLLSVALGTTSCGQPVEARRSDGTLVLEVGGPQPSLRAALLAAGVEVPPPIRLAMVDGAAAPAANAEAQSSPSSAAPSAPAPPVAEPASATPKASTTEPAAYFVVQLAPKQTLIHLAKRHLGDGNRFRELMELNGWSEADARRLQPGTAVKIPRADAPR